MKKSILTKKGLFCTIAVCIAVGVAGCNKGEDTDSSVVETVRMEETENEKETESIEMFVTETEENGIEELNAKQGITVKDSMEEAIKAVNEQEITENSTEITEDTIILDEAYEQEEESGVADFTVTPMDSTMYAAKNCNVRQGPDADTYDRIGALQWSEEVHVTGKVNEANWYEISLQDGNLGYVSGSLLQESKPTAQPSIPVGNNGGGSSTNDGTPINPETGQPWKAGDKQHYTDGGSSIYCGSFDTL